MSDEEAAAYDNAIANKTPLSRVSELEDALQRAYEDIEKEEISNGIAYGDEYALEFFGLTDADEDELDEWDANDLDELPLIKDFVEDFEPYSPYDEGWTLHVEFVDPNE